MAAVRSRRTTTNKTCGPKHAGKPVGGQRHNKNRSTSRCPRIILCMLALPLLSLVGAAIFLRPWQVRQKSFNFGTPPSFEGPLTPNKLLTRAEKLFNNKVKGPETIAWLDGHLYTGTSDGTVLDIYDDNITVLARLGTQPCGTLRDEPTCGRPLGIVVSKQRQLIVVDTYLGVFEIDPHTGHVATLFKGNTNVEGELVTFLNDAAVTSEGVVYVSQTTTRWTRKDFRFLGLENNDDGRILRYDPDSGNVSSVCRGVYHANGLVLSQDETYLLAAESVRAQIVRCYVKGPRKGVVDFFAENLPGFPDNIRKSSSSGYWLAMTGIRNSSVVPPFWQRYGERPLMRLVVFRWQELLARPWIRDTIAMLTGRPPFVRGGIKTYGLVLELDADGRTVRSLHDPTGSIVGLSHVEDVNGTLYLGSAFNNYIGRLHLESYS